MAATRPTNKSWFQADSPRTSALARQGKRASPWRFGIPGVKGKPPKPAWVK